MIVVSNTSPLTNLAAIGQFDLLQSLYTQVHIAEGVWDELNASGKKWPGCHEVMEATSWISRLTVKNQDLVTTLRQDLDRGEAESIALGLELDADFILLDEKEGRRMAKRLGLKRVGGKL
jgi:predicted nucleic acid-binding protein